jgi:hypothetical protein
MEVSRGIGGGDGGSGDARGEGKEEETATAKTEMEKKTATGTPLPGPPSLRATATAPADQAEDEEEALCSHDPPCSGNICSTGGRVKRFIRLTEIACYRELVRREIVSQNRAKALIKKMDEVCPDGGVADLFVLTGLQAICEGRARDLTKPLEDHRLLHRGVKKTAHESMWKELKVELMRRMVSAIKGKGLRPVGYEGEDERGAVSVLFKTLIDNEQLDREMERWRTEPVVRVQGQGNPVVEAVAQLGALTEHVAETWEKEAVWMCILEAMDRLEDLMESEALGGPRAKTAKARKLAQPEEEKGEKGETRRVMVASRAGAAAAGGGVQRKAAPLVSGEVVLTQTSVDGEREMGATSAASAVAAAAAASGRHESVLSSDG